MSKEALGAFFTKLQEDTTLQEKLIQFAAEQGFEFGFGGVVRTARRLFEGCVYVPSAVWDGKNGATAKAE